MDGALRGGVVGGAGWSEDWVWSIAATPRETGRRSRAGRGASGSNVNLFGSVEEMSSSTHDRSDIIQLRAMCVYVCGCVWCVCVCVCGCAYVVCCIS